MDLEHLRLYSLVGGEALGDAVAQALGAELSMHEERQFEDGEHKIRSLVNVEQCDVYIVQSLSGEPGSNVNDKLVRLLFFAGALRDAGARRVHVIAPYLCYARKDRRTKIYDPVSTRYVAQLFEAVGIAGVLAVDVHNDAAFENAFRCRNILLSARDLFVRHFAAMLGDKAVTVASPDLGGAKRADAFRQALQVSLGREVGSAIMEKHRSAGVVSGELLAGDIAGRCILLLDDLIAGGGTMRRAAEAFVAAGAAEVHAIATHAVFGEGAQENLATPELRSIVTTNSIKSRPEVDSLLANKLVRLDMAPLLASGIRMLASLDTQTGIVFGA